MPKAFGTYAISIIIHPQDISERENDELFGILSVPRRVIV